jgi:hypothetical protein
MRLARVSLFAVTLLIATTMPARADITGFIGANTTPENRSVRGFGFGAGLLLVGFEFEYAATSPDTSLAAPSIKTGSGNLLLQTPVMIHGFQPYVTVGGGLYRERLGTHVDTGFAPNSGVGVKIALAGPLRLRVDYRVFRLGSGALYSPAHRLYGGLNLKF